MVRQTDIQTEGRTLACGIYAIFKMFLLVFILHFMISLGYAANPPNIFCAECAIRRFMLPYSSQGVQN